MKNILLILLLGFSSVLYGQIRTTGITYTVGIPVHTPSASQGSLIAIDTSTKIIYGYYGIWKDLGATLQFTGTSGVPSGTPTDFTSRFQINTGDSLYVYYGGVWKHLNDIPDLSAYVQWSDTLTFIATKQDVNSAFGVLPDSLLSGYGVSGYIPQYNGVATFDTTGIFWSEIGQAGIGTTTPVAKLELVTASTSATDTIFYVRNGTAGDYNIINVLANGQVFINSNAGSDPVNIGGTSASVSFNSGYNNAFLFNRLVFYSGGNASGIQGFYTDPGIAIGYAQTTTNPNTGSPFSVKAKSATAASPIQVWDNNAGADIAIMREDGLLNFKYSTGGIIFENNQDKGVFFSGSSATSIYSNFTAHLFRVWNGSAYAQRGYLDNTGLLIGASGTADRSLHVENATALTNTINYPFRLTHITSGTATTSFGTGVEYELENASGTNIIAGTEEFTWNDATDATEDATWDLKLMKAGVLTSTIKAGASGIVQFSGYNTYAQRYGFNNGVGGGYGYVRSFTDGIFQLVNNAETDFNRLTFGGTTLLYPSLKRSTTNLIVRLADDSANTDLEVADEAYGVGWDASLEVPTKNAIYDKIEVVAASSTLAGVSLLSTDATKSRYTMTSTIPVEFRRSGGSTLLYLNETDGRVGIRNSSPRAMFDVGSSGGVTIDNLNSQHTSSDNLYLSNNGGDSQIFGYRYTNKLVLAGSLLGGGGVIHLTGSAAGSYVVLQPTSGNVGIGQSTPTSKLDITTNSLGVTQTTSSGLALVNTTAAAAGAQQMSPAIRWTGQGWKTTATAASQEVSFIADVLPVQGTSAPTGEWNLKSSINGGAYSTLLRVNSAGHVNINAQSYLYLSGYSNEVRIGAENITNPNIVFISSGATYGHGTSNGLFSFRQGFNLNATSGEQNFINAYYTYAPISGTAENNVLKLHPTINQTGGANGITRGIYINPTLTAAADWRSIDIANNSGYGIYQSGDVNNYFNGRVNIGTTTPIYSNNSLSVTWTGRTLGAFVRGSNATTTVTGSYDGADILLANADATTNNWSKIYFGSARSDNASVQAAIAVQNILHGASGNNGKGDIAFFTRNTSTFAERMRIQHDGNVGINTLTPDRLLHAESSTALTNTVNYPFRLSHITSGTVTTSFGIGQEYELENASGTNRVAATEEVTWSDATDATEDATYTLKLIRAGTLTTGMTLFSTGAVSFTGSGLFGAAITSGSDVNIPGGAQLVSIGSSKLYAPSNGVFTIWNNAQTDFNRLQFGGTTNLFPSWKRSTTNFVARLADDSGNTDVEVLDEAYAVGWNSSNEVPTKNAIYDKIETLTDAQNLSITGSYPDFAIEISGGNDVTIEAGQNIILSEPTADNLKIDLDRVLYDTVYTATVTGIANVASVASGPFTLTRVGDNVTFAGIIYVTPTAAGNTTTTVSITLAIPSNFSVGDEASGTAVCDVVNAYRAGIVQCNTSTDRLVLNFSSSTTSQTSITLTGQYQIL